MRTWWGRGVWALLVVVLISSVGWADELRLRDGRVVEGTLEGLTPEHVKFRTGPATVVTYPLVWVEEVSFSPRPGRALPVSRAEWERAIAAARRSLDGCRLTRSGLIGGGLLFVAGGQYLMWVGDGPLGGLLTGVGAIVALIGVASPQPACPSQRDRVEVLTRIGLEFGWVY